MGFVTDSTRGMWASILGLALAIPVAELWIRVGLDADGEVQRWACVERRRDRRASLRARSG